MEIPAVQPFLQYFGNVRERTMRVARCVPADKVDWTYTGEIHAGRSAAAHRRGRALFVCGKYCGQASRYTTHGKELAANRDEILALMERLHAESMEIFSKLSDASLKRNA